MPNHFHLIVLVKQHDNSKHKNLNNAIGTLLRSYTRSIQARENFKGSLFQQKTKAKELCNSLKDLADYLKICTHYIHANPRRAGLVGKLEDWKYSSVQHYLNMRNDDFCKKATFYDAVGLSEEKFLEEASRLNG